MDGGTVKDDIDPRLRKYLQDGVAQDWVDRRDRYFDPPLSILTGELYPHQRAFIQGMGPTFGVRNQGTSSRCVGHALANVIDIQRRMQGEVAPTDIASADMLYHMARFHDRYKRRADGSFEVSMPSGSDGGGVRALRSVIKGFYHHGCCPDHPGKPPIPAAAWQSSCYDPDHVAPTEHALLTVAQAKAARRINLGAYYRLRPVLNDYHAALNEGGALLVSARLTRNWLALDDAGRIPWSEDVVADQGSHAFVIVGYNQEGFIVLNSWGDGWGGFRRYPGVALWSYRDWGQNVVDAWVLRLGVSAPEAFDLTIGQHGLARVYGPVAAGMTPCHELMGHYLHLDDGRYVEISAYPCDAAITEETLSLLDARARGAHPPRGTDGADAERPHRGTVLWFPGSLETLDQSFALAVARKKWFGEYGLYPMTAFWCNDFAEHAMEVLHGVFEASVKKAGADAPHLDEVIEEQAQGLGRAFWRDVELSAWRSVHGVHGAGEGPVLRVARRMLMNAEKYGTQMHLVVEGAGALLFDELLRAFERIGLLDLFTSRVTTATLSLPAIRLFDFDRTVASDACLAGAEPRAGMAGEHILPFLERMNADWAGGRPHVILADTDPKLPAPRRASKLSRPKDDPLPPPARLLLPSPALERRLHVASYRRSILHLVARSFMGHFSSRFRPPPALMLGMSRAGDLLRGQLGEAAVTPIIVPDRAPLSRGPVDQLTLSLHPDLEASILAAIRDHAIARGPVSTQ